MNINNLERPNTQALTEIMRKVNAYGHAPRVIVELDKFSYVPGLKKKYDVIEFVTENSIKNVVSMTSEFTGELNVNAPTMPIEGKNSLSDMVITSRHRTADPSRPTHKGLDLDLAKGDPVVAAWSGKVIQSGAINGYGNAVTIDHGNGVKTRYGHLDATLVKTGDIVKAGQRIGLGGNSGNVIPSGGGDGSHLHFEVWKDGVDLNPEPILKGEVTVNGVINGGGKATITKGTENVLYYKDMSDYSPDPKIDFHNSVYFTAPTPLGAKRMLGFNNGLYPSERKIFNFTNTWFNDGYLEFAYFYNNKSPGDILEVRMDGKTVWSLNGTNAKTAVVHPTPITVSKGKHTFEFSMTNSSSSSSVFGITYIKCAEFSDFEDMVDIGTGDGGYRSQVWDYEDSMGNVSNWKPYGNTSIINGGDYLYFNDDSSEERGFERQGVVTFPFSVQVRLKVTETTTDSKIYISDGNKLFKPSFKPDKVVTSTGEYSVDNTKWQDYLLVCKDSDSMVIFHKEDGVWEDIELTENSINYSTNRLLFAVPSTDTGTMYIDDVKYVNRDFSSSTPTTKVERKETSTWYELGGFVYDETFYIEDDVMYWEVSTHFDMSSSTARVTLNNSHGLYSPDYVRSPIFPDNLRKNPYSYYENGEVRHVISENTPVRIYAGYGNQVVRVFTGRIKGEIEVDSEQRTVTFNCVDMYDLLEECVLLKPMSFPPEEYFNGESKPRPWIKSSIVQALVVHAGLTGWRYVWEDLVHPDLVIEETYFTDVNQTNNTFMKFDSKGELKEVSLGEIKTPAGYKNPFVEAVVFDIGERVSDCIRKVVDDIDFRAVCNRYGTFIMHHLDFENNMRWDFKSGENLYTLNDSVDYSRVRNHIIVTGSKGNQEHFFDKDLFIACKGQIRTAQIDCPWIDENDGASARGAKKVVADKLFFDMKRQARTKSVAVKGNPFIEVLDGCYVYDANTSTSGYYIIKGNRLIGDQNGMVNQLELTWGEEAA